MDFVNRVIRPSRVMGICLATLIGLGDGFAANAAPPDDPDQASCVYTLSKPFVVDMSGTKVVSATLSSLPCTGDILPNSQTVCLQMQGSSTPPRCEHQGGYTIAQVYYQPYRPGSTYISTGTGCGAIAPSLVSACATQGPYSSTL